MVIFFIQIFTLCMIPALTVLLGRPNIRHFPTTLYFAFTFFYDMIPLLENA